MRLLALGVAVLAVADVARVAHVAHAEPVFFGRTGDLVTIDLRQAFGGSAFGDLQFAPVGRGEVRSSGFFGEGDFADTGRFYFAPDVGPEQATSRGDRVGKGFQGTLGGTATVDGVVRPFTVTVGPQYSAAGPDAVPRADDRLSRARQQHRLNYLGFPARGGEPLSISGFFGPETTSAVRLFQASLFNTNPSRQPGNFGPQTTAWANALNAPRWLERVESRPRSERWATNWAIDTIAAANAADSGGVFITALSTRDGYGSDAIHATHQAGLDVDVRVPDAAENFGNGVLSASELEVVTTMVNFYVNTPVDARVDRIIFSNLDVRDEFNRRIGRNVAVGDSSGGHLNHLHIDIEPTRRFDAPTAAPGDVRHDGRLDGFDVGPFVDAVLAGNAATFARLVPGGNYGLADLTADDLVGPDDALPFIDLMLANGLTPAELAPVYALIPEPAAGAAALALALPLARRRRR